MAEQPTPSTAPEQTDAESFDALDRMLTRLALADDARLAPVLVRVLPYAITSLASPAPAVRKLVMEILSHINKRVKHRPEISLPVLDLWNIYTESTSSTIVRNFCIVYIEMAFERLPAEEKGKIAPDFLTNISTVPAQHQGIILRLVTKAIGECNIHKVDDTTAAKYRAITESNDGLLLADFCFHTLLYQTPPQGIGCPATQQLRALRPGAEDGLGGRAAAGTTGGMAVAWAHRAASSPSAACFGHEVAGHRRRARSAPGGGAGRSGSGPARRSDVWSLAAARGPSMRSVGVGPCQRHTARPGGAVASPDERATTIKSHSYCPTSCISSTSFGIQVATRIRPTHRVDNEEAGENRQGAWPMCARW